MAPHYRRCIDWRITQQQQQDREADRQNYRTNAKVAAAPSMASDDCLHEQRRYRSADTIAETANDAEEQTAIMVKPSRR